MNFDELQKQWNQQATDDVQIKRESLKKTVSIIEKIRQNFKNESIVGLMAFIFLIVAPLLDTSDIKGITSLFYYFFLLQMMMMTLFNFRRFYYINSSSRGNKVFSGREELLKLYYELRFAVESYRVMCYLSLPSVLGLFLIIFSKGEFIEWLNRYINFQTTYAYDASFLWKTLSIGALLLFTTVLFCELWINYLYGKPLKQLKKVLDELEGE